VRLEELEMPRCEQLEADAPSSGALEFVSIFQEKELVSELNDCQVFTSE
jgi:hypothetical protein